MISTSRALYMQQNTFWYHPDHLGSTNWVTDAQGEGYEHFTYTPYGEVWVEEHLSSSIHRMSHRFTGQELDPETGLYAFPARNYDPRTSRWMSADPALFAEYLPMASIHEDAHEHNQNLPGEGGIFNPINLNPYVYAMNNPLMYTDPTGRYGQRERQPIDPAVRGAITTAVSSLPSMLMDSVGSIGIAGTLFTLADNADTLSAAVLVNQARGIRGEALTRIGEAQLSRGSDEAKWNLEVGQYKEKLGGFLESVGLAIGGEASPEDITAARGQLDEATTALEDFLYDAELNPFFEAGKTWDLGDLEYMELPQ